MIIQVDSDTAEDIEAARQDLAALARSWGHEMADARPHTSGAAGVTRSDDKAIDPIAITALVLSIPSAALAVLDLTDRIQKRRRAKELIDHAQRLAAQQVTVRLMSQSRPRELTTLTPDQLLDLLVDEHPAS
jgi:hypothetical protein